MYLITGYLIGYLNLLKHKYVQFDQGRSAMTSSYKEYPFHVS